MKKNLGWAPQWNLGKALDMIIEWTKAYQKSQDMSAVCNNQIQNYTKDFKK